jgi:hypothetical protein
MGDDQLEMDEELTDLLGQLDFEDSDLPADSANDYIAEVAEKPTEKIANKDITLPEPVPVPDVIPAEQDVNIKVYFERYEVMAEEIFAACRSDRQEAQSVLAMCKERVQDAIDSGAPNAVPRMYVDALVKAVEVKANINDTAVKMIDAGAKLISAAKSQINVQQNNVAVSSDLNDILNQPMTDEY